MLTVLVASETDSGDIRVVQRSSPGCHLLFEMASHQATTSLKAILPRTLLELPPW